MRYVNRSFLLSALVILATWAAPLSAQPYAVIQDLGTLGGATSSGFRVNNSGGVIGYSTLPGESADLAFYHNGSSMQSISLGGTSSTATDVNDAGMVVGGGFTAGNLEYQAFFFYNGQVRELSLGGTFGMAMDVNEQGMVAGYSAIPGDAAIHAFLYDSVDDVLTDLGTLGGTDSYASQINEAGQVTGFSFTDGDAVTQGFRYSSGQMIALSLAPDASSWVREMNASGQVVGGAVTADGQVHAYLFSGVQMIDLGTLGGTYSEAVGINDSGVVIGNSYTNGDASQVGFVFHGGSMESLGIGGSQSMAVDINNNGVVAGEGYLPGNSTYAAFLFQTGQYSVVTLGGSFALASAINERGDLIGSGQVAGTSIVQGYRYSATGLQLLSLGGSDSFVWDINDRGDVTGDSWTPGDAAIHAYLAPGITDTIAPTTVASTTETPNAAGWFNANVTLNLSASDNPGGSDVAEVRYSLDGGAAFTSVAGSNANIPFTPDGIHVVQYYAVDNAGNQETTQSFTVQLDKTAPAVTVNPEFAELTPNKKVRPVTVNGQILDGLSGVASASFRVVDEYGEVQPSGAVTVNPDGSFSFVVDLVADRDPKDKDGRLYTLFVRGVDAAGNEAESAAAVLVPH